MATYRRRSLFGPWSWFHKARLALMGIIAVLLFVVGVIPLGWLAAVALVLAAYLWVPLGTSHPDRGMYVPQTLPYRVAAFFMALKTNVREAVNPLNSVGFGPPAADQDHGLEPGFFPPTRLSAYWSLVFALAMGWLDVLMVSWHKPAWGDWMPNKWILYAASVVGWFVFAQIVTATRRVQGDSDSIRGIEVKPAVMLHAANADIDMTSVVRTAIGWASIPVVILLLVWSFARWPLYVTLMAVPILFLATSAVVASRKMQNEYIRGWLFRQERRDYWASAFAFMRDQNPILVAETDLPTMEEHEEWLRERGLTIEDEPYAPQVKVAMFGFPASVVYTDYLNSAERIQGQLDSDTVVVAPVGTFDDEGRERLGTIGSAGFRVWYSVGEVPHILSPSIQPRMRELLGLKAVAKLREIRGIGHCVMKETKVITKPDSRKTIVRIDVVPQLSGITITSFLNNISSIRDRLGVPWVRVHKEDRATSNVISLYIGEEFTAQDVKFKVAPNLMRKRIDSMNWAYYFNTEGLSSATSGLPKLERRIKATDIVDKLVFKLPDGLRFGAVHSALDGLKATSGNNFMEINFGDDDEEELFKKLPEEERIRREATRVAKFSIIASRRDPLARTFDFGDYSSELLSGREPGNAKMAWSPGVLADDTLSIDDWAANNDSPHLLIAGASGSGKHLDVDTPILTTNGWKRMGDLVEGDVTYDIDWRPSRIIKAFEPIMAERAYLVVCDNGGTIVANETHLWATCGLESPHDIDQFAAHLPRLDLYRAISRADQAFELFAADDLYPSQMPGNPHDRLLYSYVDGQWVDATTNDLPIYTSSGLNVVSLETLCHILKLPAEAILVVARATDNWSVGSATDASSGRAVRLYPASDLVRNVSNFLRGMARKDPMDTSLLGTYTTREIASAVGKKTVTIPSPSGESLGLQDNSGGAIEILETLPTSSRMMRCISVDSPTRTYRAGSMLIPTHNSVVESSMFLQLIKNNGPGELRLHLIEPKTELQVYQDVDIVDDFVDSWTPGGLLDNSADLAEKVVEYMEQYNRAFVSHPKRPKNLKKAREIAARESEANGTPITNHPLYLPYRLLVIEECASLFADVSKEERDAQAALLRAVTELCRKARSAGIFVVALTQYPTNASIPSVIRNQMRRIGMRCQNAVASNVVIGESGLETIRTPGVGKVYSGHEFRRFRGFWVRDGDVDYGEPNDIIDVLKTVPNKSGRSSSESGSPAAVSRVKVPMPSDSVWEVFSRSQTARALEMAVDMGKKTVNPTSAPAFSKSEDLTDSQFFSGKKPWE